MPTTRKGRLWIATAIALVGVGGATLAAYGMPVERASEFCGRHPDHWRCAPPTTTPTFPTTTTTTTPPNTDPSGEAMPVGDITGWRQIFTDDFTTDVALGEFPAAVSSKWWSYPYTWKDTSRNGSYWPEKGVSIHDVVMDIWVHSEVVNGVTHFIVNAPVAKINGGAGTTQPDADQLYGRYAVRFKAEPVPGYKTAWLLWPKSNTWPRDGEIDFPEGDLTGNISAFMHRQGATVGSDQDAYNTGVPVAGAWHTAITEWGPAHCRFYLDGVLIGDSTSRIPNTPMHWVLQTETRLSGGAPPVDAQGHVLIDWVAVYAPA